MKRLFSIFIALVVLAGLASVGRGEKAQTLYTCGMHPQVILDHPGNCPICGMKLTPIRKPADASQTGERKIKVYKSTMNPGETSPTPAKDSMGMDMVPVYEDSGATDNPSAIAVDAATRQNMNLRTAEVMRGPLRKTIRTVGTIDYNETALADVTTRFKGWAVKVNVDATGQLVHRGDALFEVSSSDLYGPQVEFLQAVTNKFKKFKSVMALYDTGVRNLKFLGIDDAQIAELETNRQVLKTLKIASPISGFVVEKNVVQGQMVDAGIKLYRIADLGIVWVLAQIYEQDLPFVQLGQEVVVKVASLPDREFRGRVTFIYPTVDEKTRTAKVRLEFENPGYFLKPGMFVSAQLHAEVEASTVLVPDSAVLRSGSKNTVFIALDGGKFEARDIALGLEAENGLIQVISGLSAGEHIVTSGQFLLDSESQLREAIEKMKGVESVNQKIVKSETNSTVPPFNNSTNSEPTVYVCPMPEHVSIVYDHAGSCPICGMALVPVTPSALKKIQPGGKVLYYTCPMPEHASVHEDKPGKCPLCAMTLIPVMAAPTTPTNSATPAKQRYYCPMHPEVISDQPGKCPKCEMDLVPVKK